MAFDDLMGTAMRLVVQTEALAALAARLQLAADSAEGDAAISPLLAHVSDVLGARLDGVTPEEMRLIANTARGFLLQAADLLADPARAPGWTYEDPNVLQSQGGGSAAFPGVVRQISPPPEGLEERLARPGARFLDIGTGVARLAISVCRAWPTLSVVGLDPWEPSLALARRNIAEANLGARIELRAIGIEDLTEEATFDLAWLPGPFLPAAVLATACARVRRALAPGGWAVLGLFAGPPDPLARAVTDLRIVRSGGCLLDGAAGERLFRDAGFETVRAVTRTWNAPMELVIARR